MTVSGSEPQPTPAGGKPPSALSVLRKNLLLLGVAGILVLALVAGLTSWLSGAGDSDPVAGEQENRAPFDQAVANLAVAQGLRYEDTYLSEARDITVTAFGQQFGTVSYPGVGDNDLAGDVLRIDDRVFSKWKVEPGTEDEPGRHWKTGVPGEARSLGEKLDLFVPPQQLADRLSRH